MSTDLAPLNMAIIKYEPAASNMFLELLSSQLQILAIFTTELPDKKQNLYIQLGKDLDQFTVFRALPLEIRNMIWRQALPNWKARKIDICASYSETTSSGKKIPARRAMPVTLFVNRESRQETLRHYCISTNFHGWVHGKGNLERSVICFDPAKDTIVIGCPDCGLRYFHDWIMALGRKFPEAITRIQTLEVSMPVPYRGTIGVFYPGNAALGPQPSINALLANAVSPAPATASLTHLSSILADLTTEYAQLRSPRVLSSKASQKSKDQAIQEGKLTRLGDYRHFLHFSQLKTLNVSINVSVFDEHLFSHWAKQNIEQKYERDLHFVLDLHKDIFSTGRAPTVKAECKLAVGRWQ